MIGTISLEALSAFDLGRSEYMAGRTAQAIAYYNRAVELDPNFALACNALANAHYVSQQDDLAAENARKTDALRGRVSEFERDKITATYYLVATGNISNRDLMALFTSNLEKIKIGFDTFSLIEISRTRVIFHS